LTKEEFKRIEEIKNELDFMCEKTSDEKFKKYLYYSCRELHFSLRLCKLEDNNKSLSLQFDERRI